MAEAVLSVTLKNLNSLIQKEFGLLWGVNKEMEKLSSILSTICAVLEDAEERQLRDRAIKNWLQKLKDVADELDNILDECSMEASQLEYKSQKVRASFLSSFNPINTLFRFRIAKKMKDVLERLDEIANERVKFHLREVVEDQRHVQPRNKRETGSIVDEKHVYGRVEDKDKIVEFLLENSRNSNDVSVYPIVGMGGMGKTTLAQLVSDDERVSRHFDIKIWVCVSEDFDMKRLIKAAIESASKSACDDMSMDPLQKRLQNLLEGKRFFIVLDDVWNEDQEQWERLKDVLSCGLNGSSIVVTTRLKKVALITGTIMHQLSSLSEDDCWSLFKQRAFGNESEERQSLVKIGKEIVKKCKGNPLAAKSLGSLMRFKSEEKEWLFVMESEIWNLPQTETSILPALRLSYFHLPIELRRCFAFCAMFPKDFRIEKEKLIHLWMANDLISVKGNMDMEEIGNEICNELYWRSFFQDVYKNEFGNICQFNMHDLVHDLAQSIMGDEARFIEIDCPVNLSRARHITCYSGQSFHMLCASQKVESLRTLKLLGHFSNTAEACKFPCRLYFPSLRAFDANISMLTSISFLINTSKHLRYLNLSDTNIRTLPESIRFLQSLQTLDVSYCGNLQKLPKHMSCLRSLRHLYIYGCDSLHHMPPDIGKLTCLRTLSFFIVDRRRGCRVDELESLNLQGFLSIRNLEEVKSPMEAKKANLAGKMNLEVLRLSWDINKSAKSQVITEQVLEFLEPPPSIKALEIINFGGRHFPHWIKNCAIFENLVTINFKNCKNCLELPTALGKLPSLATLRLSGMDSLRYVDNESYNGELERGFLHLQNLFITDLPNLERLSKEERRMDFSCLSSLIIEKCPKLTSLHYLQSIKKLNILGCNERVLESVSNLQTLTLLRICDNDDLASFPDGVLHNLTPLKTLAISRFSKLQDLQSDMLIGLTALELLSITSCHMLESFPRGIFGGSNSLRQIHIDHCIKLKSLSDSFGDLTALKFLDLHGCPELETFPNGLNNLSSLQSLNLSRSKLAALPENLRHLPSLKSMKISWFQNLEMLPDWLGDLTSLRSIEIYSCPSLENLPTSIQHLTNLQKLEIRDCPALAEKCKKEIGEDWHKIAHVPLVRLRASDQPI